MTIVAVEVRAWSGGISFCLSDYVSAFHTVSVPVSPSLSLMEAVYLGELLRGRSDAPVGGDGWSVSRQGEDGCLFHIEGSSFVMGGPLAASAGLMLESAALVAQALEGSE